MARARVFSVGLVGFGHGGAVFHAPLIDAAPRLTLAAIVTTDPERRALAARRYPGAKIVPRVEVLLEGPSRVDLLVVAAPNRFHVPLAIAAIDADVSAVVDKPLAPTSAEALMLIERAARQGVMLSVFHNRRWDGDFLTVQRLIQGGALGSIIRFESRYERWRPVPRQTWREHAAPEDAGGLLVDLGSHLIDQTLVLFGPVRAVYAEVDRRRAGGQVDDDVFAALTHASGVRAHIWTSNLAGQPAPRMRALGTNATFVKWGLDVQEDALRAGAKPGGTGWGEEPETAWGRLGYEEATRLIRTEPGAYQRFYDGIVRALEGAAPPPVAPVDAVTGLKVIEAARLSSSTARVVEVAPG